MKILKSITNMPIQITITLVALLVTIFILILNGQVDFASILLISILGVGLGLQSYYGSIVFKRIASVFIVLYTTSIYTYLVSSVIGLVTQPFLLTLAGTTLFLSATYDKNYKYELRSRKLWGTLLAMALVIFKLSVILTGYSYLIAEFAGFNLVVIYTLLWRLWVRNSKKTKIIRNFFIISRSYLRFQKQRMCFDLSQSHSQLSLQNRLCTSILLSNVRYQHPLQANQAHLPLQLLSFVRFTCKRRLRLHKVKRISDKIQSKEYLFCLRRKLRCFS